MISVARGRQHAQTVPPLAIGRRIYLGPAPGISFALRYLARLQEALVLQFTPCMEQRGYRVATRD
jgi:hypothetical protein